MAAMMKEAWDQLTIFYKCITEVYVLGWCVSMLFSPIMWVAGFPARYRIWKAQPQHTRHRLVLNPLAQGVYWIYVFGLAAVASLFSSDITGKEEGEFETGLNNGVTDEASLSVANISSETPIANGILDSFNPLYDFFGNISSYASSVTLTACIFTVCVFIAAFAFAYTAWVKSLRENFIFETMQTNPPQGFWDTFEETTTKTNNIREDVLVLTNTGPLTNVDREECEKGVRTILDLIINLVMKWDTSNLERKIVYRANVMDVVYFSEHPKYKLGQDLNEHERKAELTDKRLERFLHTPVLEHYSGVVVLNDNRYTTTTETKGSKPDESIKPIALPFCLKEESGNSKFHTNLRGAPYCVATTTHEYVESVLDIVAHYKKHAEPYSKRITDQLERYYSLKTTPAKSILSIPLMGTGEREGRVNRVLNIYRNQTGMLYSREKNNQFTQITSGLITSLKVTLDMIEGAEVAKEGGEVVELNAADKK